MQEPIRVVEQVGDQPRRTLDVAQDRRGLLGDERERVGGDHLRQFALQALHLKLERVERRFQLVRSDGQEVVAQAHRVGRLAVQPSVFDGAGDAHRQLFEQRLCLKRAFSDAIHAYES